MKVERLKVDRFEQNKQIALWRQEAYNNMNKLFANFILNTRKNMGLTRTTSTGIALNYSYTSVDYLRKAVSSKEDVASVTSTSKALNGTFNIEVKQLATSGSITSAELDNLDDIQLDGMKFRIKGTEDGQFVTITVKGSTMNDLVKAINEKKDETKVMAFYDSENKRLFLQSTVTGENSKIQLSRVSGEDGDEGYKFLEKVRGEGFKKINGQDAIIQYNGVDLKYSSNNINFNGLNIVLKAEGKTTISVSTNVDGIMEKIEQLINDYNELIDKVSQAINEKRYSQYYPLSQDEKKAMHEDDVKLWEEKAKSGMLSRDELITRTLQAIRTDLYRNVGGVSGSFKNLIEIGITTESYTRGTTGGKLQIDKEKLRAAIEKDPEGVMELLFKEPEKLDRADFPDTDEGKRQYEAAERANRRDNGGIFTRVYDNLIDGMKAIIDRAGPGQDADLLRSIKSNILIDFVTSKSSISDLDREVLNINRRIDDLNAQLIRKENAYYAKFANMEKMLQQMYSQSNWLSQQFMRY
ncbi:MAG: flagellar filament capping protein FliD, partial [Tissierellia bacterium]|nr:flagellar filament capping protein FliD [Tissierellia bacterium]